MIQNTPKRSSWNQSPMPDSPVRTCLFTFPVFLSNSSSVWLVPTQNRPALSSPVDLISLPPRLEGSPRTRQKCLFCPVTVSSRNSPFRVDSHNIPDESWLIWLTVVGKL